MIHHGDLFDVLPTLAAESVDACVTDPPYELGFMGKRWDASGVAVRPETWEAIARVLKPGAHVLAFGGTRTFHRMTCAIEDAGFEIRDCLSWLYGSGFPKSMDISKAIDSIKDRSLLARLNAEIRRARVEAGMSLSDIGKRMQLTTSGQYGKWYHRGGHMFFETGMSLPSRPEWNELRRVLPIRDEFSGVYEAAERAVLHERTMTQGGGTSLQLRMGERREVEANITAPATDGGKQWEGWGTALKPAWEPIILARKPTQGTVAANVLRHGTGALNIDASRLALMPDEDAASLEARSGGVRGFADVYVGGTAKGAPPTDMSRGRWPANVLLDDESAAVLDEQTGDVGGGDARGFSGGRRSGFGNVGAGVSHDSNPCGMLYDDSGGASRFFKVTERDCLICGVRSVDRATMNACATTSASSVERHSRTIPQTIGATALRNADASLVERLVQAAPSVESLCGTCVTSIARALVEVRSTGSERAALTAFPASTPSYKSSILIQNLASFAALWANIDTIPTTASLSLLFGSVVHAIESSIRQASQSGGSDQRRFLYSAKPSREERDYGTAHLAARQRDASRKEGNPGGDNPRNRGLQPRGNFHPTVKPIALMRYLVKLVTPPGGLVLDPFTGSGTTGMACRYEHLQFIGIEREAEYVAIAEARIAAVAPLFGDVPA